MGLGFRRRGAKPVYLLSIETTCDETAAAVIEDVPGRPVPRVVSSVVASQFNLHERFGGVVPEVAAREHVRQILPVIDEALRKADIGAHELGAVAVAVRPGLVGALIVGLTAAKAIALGLEIPLVAFDHLEGHLYAAQLAYPEDSVYPAVGLVVSGGHTSLYGCQGPVESTLLGGTIDDAAGEAFDKVASLLGLGFPGGPAVEKIARDGNPKAFDLPRTFIHDARLDFSFSGLKTAALYALHGQDARNAPEALDPKVVADLAASFQRGLRGPYNKNRPGPRCHAIHKTLGRWRGRRQHVAQNETSAHVYRKGCETLYPTHRPLHRQRGDGRRRSRKTQARASLRPRNRRRPWTCQTEEGAEGIKGYDRSRNRLGWRSNPAGIPVLKQAS